MNSDKTFARTAAMLTIGAVGVTAIGVQSAMYGALERAGRIGLAEIGLAASVEMVVLAIGVVLAGRLARGMSLPLLACLGAGLLILANLAMPYASGGAMIALRALAGLAGGVLLWLANAYIVQSRHVVKLAALFLVLQTVVQFSVAAAAAALVPGNPDAIPLIMAGCGLIAFFLAPAAAGWTAIPEDHAQTAQSAFGAPGLTALATMALVQLSLVGGWILVELVGSAAQLSAATVAAATPVMLAAQVAGGLAAMAIAGRLSWSTALVAIGILLGLVQVMLGLTSAALPFLALAGAYGLLWNFALPQLTGMALAADPSLRVARIGPAAVVAGAALGPLAASTLAEWLSPGAATMSFVLPSLATSLAVIVLRQQIRRARTVQG